MRHYYKLTALAAVLLTGCSYSYSSGERAGQVSKFSRKGIFNKSWEGEILLGGLRTQSDGNGGTQTVANIFVFSADESQPNFAAIRARLDTANESGARVRVWYRQTMFHKPWRFDTRYLLDSVRIAR